MAEAIQKSQSVAIGKDFPIDKLPVDLSFPFEPIPVEPIAVEPIAIGGPTPEATVQVEGDNTPALSPSTPELRTAPDILPILTLIEGTDGPDILAGTTGSDTILAKGGDDTILGTLGNDTINGGDGFDTLDYTDLGRKITLLPQGFIGNGFGKGSQIQDIEKIVGGPKKDNTIDGSGTKNSPVFFTIDLSEELLVVEDIPGLGSVKFEVENFVNVEGTENSDSITGNNGKNKLSGNGGNDKLTGGLGNDTLTGGSGSDTLVGTDPSATNNSRKEKDTLTGGSGFDTYVLGDKSGSFYDDFGGKDFAKITDFSFGDKIQLGSGETYNTKRTKDGFNIFLVEDSGRDLIGKVKVSFGISSAKSASAEIGATDAAFASSTSLMGSTNDLLGKLPEGDFLLDTSFQSDIFVI